MKLLIFTCSQKKKEKKSPLVSSLNIARIWLTLLPDYLHLLMEELDSQ